MKTWKIGLIAASATIVGGLSSAVLWNGIAHGEWDLPGLQQQVQHVTEVTNNHEGRITNLEGKVNTPAGEPTPTPVVVTRVVTESAASTLTTAPAITTSTSNITPEYKADPTPVPEPVINGYTIDTYTYCDGTTKTIYTVGWSDGHTTTQNTEPTSGNRGAFTSSSCVNTVIKP